jgi:hypothetical protein
MAAMVREDGSREGTHGAHRGARGAGAAQLRGSADDDSWMNDEMTAIDFVSTRGGDAEIYIATR